MEPQLHRHETVLPLLLRQDLPLFPPLVPLYPSALKLLHSLAGFKLQGLTGFEERERKCECDVYYM